MARRNRRCAAPLTNHLGGWTKSNTYPRLGGDFSRRCDRDGAACDGADDAGAGRYSPPRRNRAAADLGPADRFDRRTHRDSLPLLRIVGLPGLLSRLACADNCLDCRGRGPYRSRELFPAVDLWGGGGTAVAMGRTYRMGRVRGFLPDYFDRPEPQGDACDCRRSRSAG